MADRLVGSNGREKTPNMTGNSSGRLVIQGTYWTPGCRLFEQAKGFALAGGAKRLGLACFLGQLWVEVRVGHLDAIKDLAVNALLGSLCGGD